MMEGETSSSRDYREKKSSSRDGDNVLPEDVVFQILVCLPVMFLLRFKSVCKSWRILIQSSNFIEQHLNHHSHQYSNYNFVTWSHISTIRKGINLSLRSGDRFEVTAQVNLPCLRVLYHYNINMVACNGIVCIHIKGTDRTYSKCIMNVSLWNPATKQYRALPQSPFPPPRRNDFNDFGIGFGFDVTTNDYKVVRFFILFDSPGVTLAEMYNLSTDSWRTIDTGVLRVDYIGSDPKAPYRNGSYCWLASKGRAIEAEIGEIYNHFILSFDFSSEVFGTMSLPEVDSIKFDPCPQLAILRDNLALITKVVFSYEMDTTHFEIWVLNEYGVKESWTKLYKVGPFLVSIPIGLSRNGDNFFLTTKFKPCIYNFLTQNIMYTVQETWGYDTFYKVAIYNDSLVSIDRGKGAANSATCVAKAFAKQYLRLSFLCFVAWGLIPPWVLDLLFVYKEYKDILVCLPNKKLAQKLKLVDGDKPGNLLMDNGSGSGK
ncbi:hypothetical protein IFM89_021005 [Coptis chinensis]|uniref:F-box domain-containing protein n=1 Tax=Coptis chinensis TaxID=261450 RepID=A0A835H5F8_9MAGN|nr:hypothetical protein IFM89_021005 [Coptis chinensis]